MTIKLQPGQRLVYQTDVDFIYVGEAAADPDPQSVGNWLVPGGCVETKPPKIPSNKKAQWVGYKWKLIDM